MSLPSLWSGPDVDPFRSLRREMDCVFRMLESGLPTLSVGAKTPAVNVAETAGAI